MTGHGKVKALFGDMKMTTWAVKNNEIEKWIDEWKKAILEKVEDSDLLISNNIDGSFYSPSKRKKYFRTAGFALAPDVLKDESITPFLKSVPFAFYFMPKGVIDFEKIVGKSSIQSSTD